MQQYIAIRRRPHWWVQGTPVPVLEAEEIRDPPEGQRSVTTPSFAYKRHSYVQFGNPAIHEEIEALPPGRVTVHAPPIKSKPHNFSHYPTVAIGEVPPDFEYGSVIIYVPVRYVKYRSFVGFMPPDYHIEVEPLPEGQSRVFAPNLRYRPFTSWTDFLRPDFHIETEALPPSRGMFGTFKRQLPIVSVYRHFTPPHLQQEDPPDGGNLVYVPILPWGGKTRSFFFKPDELIEAIPEGKAWFRTYPRPYPKPPDLYRITRFGFPTAAVPKTLAVKANLVLEGIGAGTVASLIQSISESESGWLNYEIPTGTTDQVIPLSAVTGVDLVEVFFMGSDKAISWRVATTDTATPLDANGFVMCYGASMTNIYVSNASGSTAKVRIYIAG